MLVALIVVATLLVAAQVAIYLERRDHRAEIAALTTAHVTERYSHARERWDLTTRLQAPELVRQAPLPPPPPPVVAPAPDVAAALARLEAHAPEIYDEPDESHLVGTVLGEGSEEPA